MLLHRTRKRTSRETGEGGEAIERHSPPTFFFFFSFLSSSSTSTRKKNYRRPPRAASPAPQPRRPLPPPAFLFVVVSFFFFAPPRSSSSSIAESGNDNSDVDPLLLLLRPSLSSSASPVPAKDQGLGPRRPGRAAPRWPLRLPRALPQRQLCLGARRRRHGGRRRRRPRRGGARERIRRVGARGQAGFDFEHAPPRGPRRRQRRALRQVQGLRRRRGSERRKTHPPDRRAGLRGAKSASGRVGGGGARDAGAHERAHHLLV